LIVLLAYDMRPEVSVRAVAVPVVTQGFGQIEDDCDWNGVELACDSDQRFAGLSLDVRRINNREAAAGQPLAHNVVQQVECL